MPQDLATTPAVTSSPRKSLRNTWVLLCLLVLSLYALAAHAQTANDGFNPSPNFQVSTSFIQSNGKIVVGGSFTGIGGHAIKQVARVNVDGSVDLTFNLGSGANGNVQVVAPVESSSATNSCGAYAGGDFTQFNGVPARMVVRFGCDGKIDKTFSLPAAAIGGVFAITTQPDGRIFIGGQFDNLDVGTPSANLARLNVNGSRDTNFSVAVNGPVRSIVVQPDGKILIGGSFTSVNGQARFLYARLNFDGSLDTSYNVAISGVGGNGVAFIQDMALQPDGKAIIVGRFTQINGVIRDSIARINTNGSLDASFAAITISAGSISAVKLQPDGKVLIGGAFGFVNGNAQQGMARLKQDGRLDRLHGLDINESVSTISVQADGGIVLGGGFTSAGGASRNNIARLTRDQILDQSFGMPPTIGALSGFVSAIAVGARGEIVIGGGSTFANTIFNFAQLVLADGSYDGSFGGNFHLNSSVSAIAIQSDGKALLGGEFTRRIERAIPHGGIDPTFNPSGVGADGTIKAIVIQPDGKILIAGSFTHYNNVIASNIARLDANGGLDRTFNANFIHPDFFVVNAFALQPDGKIIIGGQGILLRLTDKGDVDQSFASGAVPSTDTINVISYSKNNGAPQIFVGGTFSQMRGVPTKNVAKLTDSGEAVPAFVASTDGSVFSIVQQQGHGLIIGGNFTQVNGVARANLAQLGPFFGEVGADYATTSVENGAVLALALQTDGKLLIGGSFTSVNGVVRSRFARLSAVHAVQPSWRLERQLSGGGNFVQFSTGQFGDVEIGIVQFDISTDATNWTNLGSAESNNGTATLDNLKNLPKGRLFYIRARARVPSGQGNGSSSPYEQIKQFFIPSTDARDLDGDGKSDLIFRNSSTGQLTGWIMDGLDTLAAVGLVAPGAWTVSHTADFNGDGKADILFRNDDGSATLWLMDGLTVTDTIGLIGPNPDWRATHVGDFDGDGKADILWRNTNGAVTLWLMDGTTIKSAVGLLEPNPDWSVSHVGDFNGDTAADILWRNTNGAVTMWLSVNPDQNIFTSAGLLGPNPDWSVSHVGDFNRDGKADILWRNNNGAVTMWLMNGAAQIAAAGMLGPNPDWRVSHVADFNGDGNADLLWRNNNGAVTQWLMDGVSAFAITGLLDADPNWRVTHTGDYNGDGKADLLWRNFGDGSISMWQMDGSVIKQTGGVLGPGPWNVVPAQ